MDNITYRVAGYRRVSMRDQLDGHSLEAQEVHIRQYAEARGWEVVQIYTDAGLSAKKDSHRPALSQLMAEAQAGKFNAIIVDKIDRFYRHLNGLLKALDELNSLGTSFVSVQEQLDFTTPWGKLTLTMLGMLAEIYIDNLRQETRKGKRQRARKGLWNGSLTFGYCRGLCSHCTHPSGKDYCPSFGKPDRGDGKILIPHPIESMAVKLIYQWYASGKYSMGQITDMLNQYECLLEDGRHVKFRNKNMLKRAEAEGCFTKDSLRGLLQRVFYIGKVPYYGPKPNGKKRKRIDYVEIYPGQHQAIVDEETYRRVQDVRALMEHNSRFRHGKPVNVFPLSGMLRCGQCGGMMRAVSGESGRHYRDASRIEHTQTCNQKNVKAGVIENQVLNFLRDVIQRNYSAANTEQAHTELIETDARLARVKELYIAGEIDRDRFDDETERLLDKKKGLRPNELDANITLRGKIADSLKQWDNLLPTEQKRLLRLLIEVAYLRENALVGLQPTSAFLSLLRETSKSNCGPDGAFTFCVS